MGFGIPSCFPHSSEAFPFSYSFNFNFHMAPPPYSASHPRPRNFLFEAAEGNLRNRLNMAGYDFKVFMDARELLLHLCSSSEYSLSGCWCYCFLAAHKEHV
eukprot:TRINITY_DN4780_c1_g1_i14.p1 TRINITY_DN4780_c1_g1~~TRINITY_DN4780_c1_g1_i14.p1  ORF type:complete len:101 (-),score=16.44 TRINITY_DN4780_c1_g1_i14:581-883(-)